MLEYRGYVGAVEADDGSFVGRVAGLRDVVTFEGATYAEVEEAFRHSKRIIPVQALPLGDHVPPARLSAINYVRFDQEPGGPPRLFMEGMSRLRSALNTDLTWVREHTRLLSRSSEWEAAGRVGNRMLSGTDIAAAKRWLAHRPKGAPAPTELHRDYIAASEQAETARECGRAEQEA